MHQHKKILVFDKLWKRLRYKQSTELKYHSIPKSDLSSKKSSRHSQLIKLSNHNLRYVSYSIPLLCIMLLLGLGVIILNPTIQSETFAQEATNNTGATKPSNQPTSEKSGVLDVQNTEEAESSGDIIEGEELPPNEKTASVENANEVNLDGLIMPLATNSSVSLNVSDEDMAATTVPVTGVAYRSHNVTVNATDISSYSLTISYAEDNGAMRLEQNQNFSLSDANGTTMINMAEDSWGWTWTNTSTATNDYADLNYYGMPQLGTSAINKSTGLVTNGSPADHNANFTGKLIFGAKFSSQLSEKAMGTYHTSAMLSLAAIPNFITQKWSTGIDSGIANMQDMTAEICNQVDKPTSASDSVPTLVLEDTRGGGYTNGNNENSYILAKLGDGNCWMMQNIKLTVEDLNTATGSTKLTILNSDVASDTDISGTTINTLSSNYFRNEDYYKSMIYNPSETENSRQKGYGAYYSWCAATAGKCSAEASICPKGWKLPLAFPTTTSGTRPNYMNLSTIQLTSGRSNDYGLSNAPGYKVGYGFFTQAGYVSQYGLSSVGDRGLYWTASPDSTMNAYYAYFYYMADTSYESGNRGLGIPVRCVIQAS